MTEQESFYKQDHKIAKAIVYLMIVVLLVLNKHFDLLYLDVLAVSLWFWCINSIAYVIETIRGHSHNHDKL